MWHKRLFAAGSVEQDGPWKQSRRCSFCFCCSPWGHFRDLRCLRGLKSAEKNPGLLKHPANFVEFRTTLFFKTFFPWLSRSWLHLAALFLWMNHFPDPVCNDLQPETQPPNSRCRSRCLQVHGREDTNVLALPCALGSILFFLFRERERGENPPDLLHFLL